MDLGWRLRNLRWKARVMRRRHKFGAALLRNRIEDARRGGWTGGNAPATRVGSNPFGAAHYYELDRIFRAVPIHPSDVLVDVGCGKGRVLGYWAGLGNRCVGLELLEDVAEVAAQRMSRHPNVQVKAGDALENLPADGTLYWLFTPFMDGEHGRSLMQRLSDLLLQMPSPPRLVIYRGRHIGVFESDPRWRVESLDLGLFYGVSVVAPAG